MIFTIGLFSASSVAAVFSQPERVQGTLVFAQPAPRTATTFIPAPNLSAGMYGKNDLFATVNVTPDVSNRVGLRYTSGHGTISSGEYPDTITLIGENDSNNAIVIQLNSSSARWITVSSDTYLTSNSASTAAGTFTLTSATSQLVNADRYLVYLDAATYTE